MLLNLCIAKIYESYTEMRGDILRVDKLFKDELLKREQTLEMTHKPTPNPVEYRKIQVNTNKNNVSEGKEL